MRGFRSVLPDRQALWAFVAGCLAVTAGVVLHLPMFLMGSATHYRLAGMPMGADMLSGMGLIIVGVFVAAYGLLPRNLKDQRLAGAGLQVTTPEEAPLSAAHWRLMAVLVVALVIDVMKPASLGFTVPGMISEYGVPRATVSLVPFFALLGTAVGSILWGVLADIYGRKASILLAAVMFVGTSICGAMPSLNWNIGMCFMMGAAAGGMLPVTYALLAEMMPNRHRGWSLVLVGGLGSVGGYFAASGLSALLQPVFGWRILWLLNLPTGLTLVLLGGFIPESAKFLLARGRTAEAAQVMQRFGSVARRVLPLAQSAILAGVHSLPALSRFRLIGNLSALSIAAVTWGLVNFGLLLWLPAELVARGYSVSVSSELLAKSALLSLPTIFVAAYLYSQWSTKWSLVTMIGVTLLGIVGVIRVAQSHDGSPVLAVALLIVGSNGMIAMLLPYAAESFPLHVRGRATGWIAACSKGGGVLAQSLSISALVPAMGVAASLMLIPAAIALLLIAWLGLETRGSDLRTLESAGRARADVS